MRFSTIFDPQNAGRKVHEAAVRRGHIHDDASPEVAYVRTINYGPWKSISLGKLAELHRRKVPSVPGYADSLVYDDKRPQVRLLAPWSPATRLITDPRDVDPSAMTFPFVSKSAEGSASKNVRLIRSEVEARAEADAVFGSGLTVSQGSQIGYLIWQDFVPGNDRDVRVVVNGSRLYGLYRGNRDNVPFASGSGRLTSIASLDDVETLAAFEIADEIAEAIESRWCCFDFVFQLGQPLVLEVSFSWSERAYTDCVVFDRETLEPTGETAAAWAEFAVDEMERLAA